MNKIVKHLLVIFFGVYLLASCFANTVQAHNKLAFVNIDYSLIEFHIKQNEGKRLKVYLDTKGNLTAGYGHKITNKRYKLNDRVSTEQINRWFKADIQTALNCAIRFLKNDYKSKELIVVTDMAFNMGCDTLNDFWRLRKHINNRDYVMATKAIKGSDYYKQLKPRADRNILILNQ